MVLLVYIYTIKTAPVCAMTDVYKRDLCVCLSVTELFKRRGRGVALATHAVASRATQGLLVYIYKRDLSPVRDHMSLFELFKRRAETLPWQRMQSRVATHGSASLYL